MTAGLDTPEPPSPTLGLKIGATFQGRYDILSELGAGSSGVVYRARQLSTGQDVAIKLLHLRSGETVPYKMNAVERFRRELRLCVDLSHPNIVPLVDCGESADGFLYAVFHYVPGATLKDVLAAEGKLGIAETVHLMSQVLDALSCAHLRGIVHRDLKPGNIILTTTSVRRNALVLDFGLGGFAQEARQEELPRITATQEMLGTPCYAAPEQLRGEPPSARSDLYSWGLMFLECLTGELAIGGGSPQEVILKQLGPDPVPIPSWLADRRLRRILETVTAKQVEKRDVTIEGLLHALGACVPSMGAPSPGATESLDGERRQLTVVSCGLTVTGADEGRADVEALDELLHAQHAALAELAAGQGGQVAGVLADRILFAFGYPQAHENDARRAARTALRMAAEVAKVAAPVAAARGIELTARFGVHTGVVITRELRQGIERRVAELVGITPQIAARVEALAGPGEVLVTAETRRLLRGDLQTTEIGEHALGGIRRATAVYRLADAGPAVRDTLSYAPETPIVGRDHELAQLVAAWRQATSGRGAAILLTGEPGIGKSRLLREIRREIPRDAWLECRCVAEDTATPLRPVADLVLNLDESLENLLTRYGLDVASTWPLLALICALPSDDRFPPLQLSPERAKELTLNALVTLFARVAAERPIALAIEDLHWADPTSVELVTQLIAELRSAAVVEDAGGRILLLLTARPEFDPPWAGDDVAAVQLPRLDAANVEAMIRSALGHDQAIPPPTLAQIVRRADGIPLFVEEVTRVLGEAGLLGAADPGDQPAPQIPSTLRDLLMGRIDALSFGARETAQLAAVLGREFRYEEVRAVARKNERVLREDLRELTDAGLVYYRRSTRTETYVFKHALVRDVAYETMLRSARQHLHGRVANTLRQRFPELERQRPELLALHYESGDEPELAVEYWKHAGDRTMARGAYAESLRHFERGLGLVGRLPESPERLRQELGLLESLGTAQLATRGYTAPEVVDAFTRAETLCARLGGNVPIRTLNGIWGVHMMRGDRDATARMIPTMEYLARTSSDPVSLIMAHGAIGVRAFFSGDFNLAASEMERATTWYRTRAYDRFLEEYGYDGGIYVFGYRMWSLLILGDIARARAARDETMAMAEKTRNPYGVAIATQFSMNLERDLGNARAVLAIADEAIPFLTEQKLYMWLGWASTMRGWALAMAGEIDAGIAQVEFGVQLVDSIGVRTGYGYFLSGLADAHLARGAATEGLAVVERALATARETLDCFYVSELQRLKGALFLAQGERGQAEAHFREALALARSQQSNLFALRAAMSLARFLADAGEHTTAYDTLSEACTAFADVPGSVYVGEARALCEDLARRP
jgi:TOMM system kinase/cyclase fusion protein